MRHTPLYDVTDPNWVRRLIREYPWATIVSMTSGGLVASHYPVLVSGEGDEIVIETHVGRPDERLHELGQHEMLMIFQGPHGYISSSWLHDESEAVPTWNFTAVHLHGRPEVLSDDENLAVLERITDYFESQLPEPRFLRGTLANSEYADRLAKGTVGFRMRATSWVAKNKLGQSRSLADRERIVAELAAGSPYADPRLASDMQRALDEAPPR